jgi:hypothetical protein
LVLAGVTEFGTWGAADFVSQEEHVAELISRLKIGPGDPIPPFEALLRIKVQGGVPIQSDIVSVRRVR